MKLSYKQKLFSYFFIVFAAFTVVLTVFQQGREKAYKTDRGTYLSYAIELFVLSIITLYMPYVYYYQNTLAQLIFTTSAVYIFIYYAIKSIFYLYKIYDIYSLHLHINLHINAFFNIFHCFWFCI